MHETAATTLSFRQRADVALNDQALRDNFRGAMRFLRDKRQSVFDDETQFRSLQMQSQRIRESALKHLPELLEQLEANCTANGMQVHWAEDAAEACTLIASIITAHQGRQVVKGKSMASEEISLNHALAKQGIQCIESDMGEFIVQLADETPSHIIMPAIHKSKEQIAHLFEDKLVGVPYTDQVDELIGIGRRVLREKFYEADIGISGVNFAVAETGTLCLVENEGNGRMSTTVPPVHIAIAGIEKVIPRLTDLPPLLSSLTRSATGQIITTYVNLISSPRKPGEKDGPLEVHLVLLDNGRSRMYLDQQLQKTLLCIRCGACMNHCPVYTRIGGHAYGSVYPGPIGQIVMPQIEGLQKHGEMTDACSLNGACGDVCPVGIPLPDLIRRLREEKSAAPLPAAPLPNVLKKLRGAGSHRKRFEAASWLIWKSIYRSPRLYQTITWLLSRLRWLMPPLPRAWTRYRTLPRPAANSLHEILLQRSQTGRQTTDRQRKS
jgi:L-lactate dehydrogenase complex protein LldF